MYDDLCGLLPFPAEHPAWVAVLIQMVELIQRFGDAPTAEIVYRQLLPYPGALGSSTVFFQGTVSRNLGELAEIFGDRAMAIELLREALPRNRAIGAPPDTALTLLGLARLLRDGNRADMAEAATLTQDALDLAVRLDMPGTVAAAGQIAVRLVLSERTVESHVRSILAKTQCANRTEFVASRVIPPGSS